MIDEIRTIISKLSKEEFSILIEIPRSVLLQDVDIPDNFYPKWQDNNKEYFCGNLVNFKEDFFVNLYFKINECNYYIDDMINTIDYIKYNFDELIKVHGRILELPLRNVEVTLKDCRVIDNDNLMCNGDLFAKHIKTAIK